MKKSIIIFFGQIATILIVISLLTIRQPVFADSSPQYNTPIPPTPAAERFYRIDLERASAESPQIERGKEVYRLVCSACHAYDGSGLTAEWIATWDPADQNCWQSKCHGPNHPVDGFEIPQWSPPVVGPNKLAPYATAREYFDYIDQNMPWYAPGTVVEDQIWDVTAYLLSMNQVELKVDELNRENANLVVLNAHLIQTDRQTETISPTPAATASLIPPAGSEKTPLPWWLLIALPAVAGVVFLLALVAARKKADGGQ